MVYGPPIVGKTILSKQICEAYGLMYVSLETAAQDVMEDLVSDDQAFFSHNLLLWWSTVPTGLPRCFTRLQILKVCVL